MSVQAIDDFHPLYGIMAEFETAGDLVEAARRVKEAGFRKFDAYSPFPIHELDEAMDLHDNRISLLTLIGGLIGCIGGYSLCWWVEAVALPLNIGGRPPNSMPMYIPITFELTVLVGGLTAFFGQFAINGLPHPYHPVFNVDRFANASRNKFFLCIESADPQFDRNRTASFLESLNPEEVAEVAR